VSPSLELQGAVVVALKASLVDLAGDRVYDSIPTSAVFPYVSFGASWEAPDDAECIDAVAIGFRVDVWSRATGFAEVRRIADAVRRALHNADLSLSENALVMIQHERTDTMRDPDGLTSHAALEFSATVEIA